MQSALRTVLGLVLTAVAVNMAQAQAPLRKPPPAKPVVSPYLNLNRAGNSEAFNYLTLVRPELQIRQGISELNQLQQAAGTTLTSTAEPEAVTGHAFGFMTHRRYFMTLGGGGTSLSTTGPRSVKTPTSGGKTSPPSNAGSAPRAR